MVYILCLRSHILRLQVDPSTKPYKNLQLYEMLVELMREEENVELHIRDSEKEVHKQHYSNIFM